METKEYSDFYESAKRIVAAILEKEALEKIGFIQKPDNPEILGEHMRVGYIDEFISGDLLEKAWKMPWGCGKSEDFKPVLVFNRDILQISHASDEVYNAYDYLWDFVYPKRLYTDEN